jgi:hypothetical protein
MVYCRRIVHFYVISKTRHLGPSLALESASTSLDTKSAAILDTKLAATLAAKSALAALNTKSALAATLDTKSALMATSTRSS